MPGVRGKASYTKTALCLVKSDFWSDSDRTIGPQKSGRVACDSGFVSRRRSEALLSPGTRRSLEVFSLKPELRDKEQDGRGGEHQKKHQKVHVLAG